MVGRDAYKQAITQRLIPALRAFSPDLILLSTGLNFILHHNFSGFDPASGDVGNLKNNGLSIGSPLPGMNLRPWDFEWVTTEMIKIADICCNGKLVHYINSLLLIIFRLAYLKEAMVQILHRQVVKCPPLDVLER